MTTSINDHMTSATAWCRQYTTHYCLGNGVDIGSGCDPVVPWAIQVDLPDTKFQAYGHGHPAWYPVQWRGDGLNLPFKDGTLDFVYSSHLIEDFLDWKPILTEWVRVLKPGGHIVIMLPDKKLFNEAIRRGGGGNANHKHESYPGELTSLIGNYGKFEVICDRLTQTCGPDDYNILFVAKKLS